MRAATSASEPVSISAWLPDAGGYSRRIESGGVDRGCGRQFLELRRFHRRADPAHRHVAGRLLAPDAQHGRQLDFNRAMTAPGNSLQAVTCPARARP